VPRQRHFYSANHLHFLTPSTYRRARRFDSERFQRQLITLLADRRAELGLQKQESGDRSQESGLRRKNCLPFAL
jgi:hypothetical protein